MIALKALISLAVMAVAVACVLLVIVAIECVVEWFRKKDIIT